MVNGLKSQSWTMSCKCHSHTGFHVLAHAALHVWTLLFQLHRHLLFPDWLSCPLLQGVLPGLHGQHGELLLSFLKWKPGGQLSRCSCWLLAWCFIALHADGWASLGHRLRFIVTLCLLACLPILWSPRLLNSLLGPTDSKSPLAGETFEEDSGRQLEGLCRALSVQGWWWNGVRHPVTHKQPAGKRRTAGLLGKLLEISFFKFFIIS